VQLQLHGAWVPLPTCARKKSNARLPVVRSTAPEKRLRFSISKRSGKKSVPGMPEHDSMPEHYSGPEHDSVPEHYSRPEHDRACPGPPPNHCQAVTHSLTHALAGGCWSRVCPSKNERGAQGEGCAS
jgi:hypothetical protein